MRTFGLAALVFLSMAAVGAQIHEGGHYGAARALGWSPELHHGGGPALVSAAAQPAPAAGGRGARLGRSRGDESRVAPALHLRRWGLDDLGGGLAGLAGLRVLSWMPHPVRFSAGGATGSLMDFALWFAWLGPPLPQGG